ncbi:16S rRNA (guanine(527)-N(7))-methyltransferase RsmG [Alistipes sp. ZOR0009]|jgi:16S rRNA (guanine527-N7)-methyltransferase|uniref:16S rRNA (guanine(527)-N(7))-methyltransferase RsmG n=1 Tax=Alistipes sp. ZOR0009 TaxID=1339253 RepID=UPI000648DCD8|nr:16S rRNA (guanine(527)-N(7))-methyltransferase RsmG [Alistipes sp. ZOR0009]
MEIVEKYFPNLTDEQKRQFGMLKDLYSEWNDKINVISRKDIDNLYVKHVLHSLAIAKVVTFKPGTKILDVGTGGGFPGIPLAILFPEVQFTLVDSIGKKITVVQNVAEALGLKNVKAMQARAENLPENYDFVVSRAVTDIKTFCSWVWKKIIPRGNHAIPNGILYLKGGDLTEELSTVPYSRDIFNIPDFFDDEFFETKKVVYLQK